MALIVQRIPKGEPSEVVLLYKIVVSSPLAVCGYSATTGEHIEMLHAEHIVRELGPLHVPPRNGHKTAHVESTKGFGSDFKGQCLSSPCPSPIASVALLVGPERLASATEAGKSTPGARLSLKTARS